MTPDNNPTPEPVKSARPWSWIPTLYIAEGLPLVMVTVVSTIMYTRLGASLSEIGYWTSILGFAWVIKPLWGPLVDLYGTKRRWSILMQILIGLLLGGVALFLNTDWWWTGSLAALALVALFSATHDIAADGFYMDALNEKQQSFFVGIRSTFYRIAMIFGQGILLIIAGMVEQRTGPTPTELVITGAPAARVIEAVKPPEMGFVKFEPATLVVDAGSTASVMVSLNQQPDTTRTVTLRRVASSMLSEFLPFGPEQQVALADKKDEVLKFNGQNWNVPQEVVFAVDKNLKTPVVVPFKAASGNLPLTWAFAYGGIGLLMAGFGLYHLVALPKPKGDGAGIRPTTPFIKALGVMFLVVAVPVALYLATYKSIFWGLKWAAIKSLGEKLPFNESVITFASVFVLALIVWIVFQARAVKAGSQRAFSKAARISHVPFDEVFASFFARPGIGRMVAFLLLYRLGEGLLVKMSGPFLVKPVVDGGMGLSSAEYGLAYGTFGILAMTVGGILGGLVASRHGLKRWILPMCLAINVPDLFYVYLAYAQPPEIWKIYACVSAESFGYGFGFTAYMLYMLYIADTGEHKTSHFALCTGFMALGMMLPGMVSGDLAQSLGWPLFFVVVCIATIPGFLMLPIIPLDKEFGRRGSGK